MSQGPYNVEIREGKYQVWMRKEKWKSRGGRGLAEVNQQARERWLLAPTASLGVALDGGWQGG